LACTRVNPNTVCIGQNTVALLANNGNSAVVGWRLGRSIAGCNVYPRKRRSADPAQDLLDLVKALRGELKLFAACRMADQVEVFW
jgi:hypothetical protein